MIPLSRIGQGTWDIPESGSRIDEAVRALRRGIELGMTHIDTAEMYGNGAAEELVGRAMSGLPRERLFITSKVLPGNASYDGTLAACKRSLERLRTPYVDLYLLHWPSAHPLAQTMRALEEIVNRGWARYIGVSNFDLDELQEAQKHLERVPLSCDQVLYHLRERGIEQRLIPHCLRNDIAVVGYTPFGRSRFPARGTPAFAALDAVARKHGKSVRQVILNFLTREAGVFTIPKASRVEHAEENAGAAGWNIDADDAAAIDAAFPVRDGPLATL